jgi:hypothetical protein
VGLYDIAKQPSPPDGHQNGLFKSGGILPLSWEEECRAFANSQAIFQYWNSASNILAKRCEGRGSNNILHRAMAVYPHLTLKDGSGSNLIRISAKWRIAMVILSIHNTQCRLPLMKKKGVSAALYTGLLDAIRHFTHEPTSFDFVVALHRNAKANKYSYLEDPKGFIQQLQGIPPSDDESDDQESPLRLYNSLRRGHQKDIHALRSMMKKMGWIHCRQQTTKEISSDIVDAWNEFESVCSVL